MVDCMLKNGIKMNSWERSHPSPLRAVPAAFPGCTGTQCALMVRGEEKSEKHAQITFPRAGPPVFLWCLEPYLSKAESSPYPLPANVCSYKFAIKASTYPLHFKAAFSLIKSCQCNIQKTYVRSLGFLFACFGLFFDCIKSSLQHAGSKFSDHGSDQGPWHWECRVSATKLPGESLCCFCVFV